MIRVLLCSPNSLVGGIAIWTNHILKYYESINEPNIEISQYYGERYFVRHADDSFIVRIYNGIYKYIPLYKGVLKRLDTKQIGNQQPLERK